MRSIEVEALLLFVLLSTPAATAAQGWRGEHGSPAGAVLQVAQPGVIEVAGAALAEVLETSSADIENLIRSGSLDLRLGGESVAWHAVHDGAAIRFVAPEIRSPFSDHHRYLLLVQEGVTMEERALVRSVTSAPHMFLATKRFEENIFPGPTGAPDPRQDLFFWHALAANAEAAIAVSLPGLRGSAGRELRVYVHGATEHPEQPHRVELHWNGGSLGTFDLLGRKRHIITVPLEPVAAGLDNELIVQQHVAGEAPAVLYVDAVEVDYERLAEADGPAFRFGGAQDGSHSVAGLASQGVHLYQVTDPNEPKSYGEVLLEESGGLTFTEAGTDLRFLAVALDNVSSPVEVTPYAVAGLRSTDHDVDYVIVAASHLLADAEALAELREADGYRVLLADIDEVYWEFADGVADPLAVRDFLAFAWDEWNTAPRFAVLLGTGSLDYRDLMGLGGNSFPPALATTPDGLFPSDSILGDVVGVDGAPEIAIGRLPITTAEELGRVIDAIESFEAGHASMDALFAADDSEHDEFAAAARLLADWAAPERVEEIDLNSESRADARERLLSMWGSLSWMTYVGHSGPDRMASEGLLTLADVPALSSMSSAPVVVGWTCNMVRFDIPGFSSLGEQLISEGASAGVFSATGWSNHFETDLLRTAFTEAVFASEAETIGEAMIRAHQAATDASVPQHRVYALLGDPALRLRAAKSEPSPEPSVDPPPLDGTGQVGARPDASPSPAHGCEIKPPGASGGPFKALALLLGVTLLIVCRRA